MSLIHHFPTPWDDPEGHPDTDCLVERCGEMPAIDPFDPVSMEAYRRGVPVSTVLAELRCRRDGEQR